MLFPLTSVSFLFVTLYDTNNSLRFEPGHLWMSFICWCFSRDGVSESQFQQVLETELLAFKKALRSLEKDNSNYNPKITFIVVQKRHHTRFFPANGQGNVMPGKLILFSNFRTLAFFMSRTFKSYFRDFYFGTLN
jgi:hypothetical protein